VVVVIGFVFTPLIARTVRSAVLNETDLEYVAAARLRGDGTLAILFHRDTPNVLPIAIVEMTVRLGYAIFFVASLSFIGFGIHRRPRTGNRHCGKLQPDRQLLVDRAVRCGGHRLAGDRREPGHRWTRRRFRYMKDVENGNGGPDMEHQPMLCASRMSA